MKNTLGGVVLVALLFVSGCATPGFVECRGLGIAVEKPEALDALARRAEADLELAYPQAKEPSRVFGLRGLFDEKLLAELLKRAATTAQALLPLTGNADALDELKDLAVADVLVAWRRRFPPEVVRAPGLLAEGAWRAPDQKDAPDLGDRRALVLIDALLVRAQDPPRLEVRLLALGTGDPGMENAAPHFTRAAADAALEAIADLVERLAEKQGVKTTRVEARRR